MILPLYGKRFDEGGDQIQAVDGQQLETRPIRLAFALGHIGAILFAVE